VCGRTNRLFHVLGSPERLDVLRAVLGAEAIDQPTLRERLSLSQPALSRHLRGLSDEGLVIRMETRARRIARRGLARRAPCFELQGSSTPPITEKAPLTGWPWPAKWRIKKLATKIADLGLLTLERLLDRASASDGLLGFSVCAVGEIAKRLLSLSA
jgi:DNA-binding transcriptional ArsR family regulator